MKHTALVLAFLLSVPAYARDTVLTILHTNDLHGRVLSTAYDNDQGPGGLARITTLVRQIREQRSDSILLDAGDAVQGTPTEFITQGESMIAAMNAAGYDGVTLGNHEFDWSQTATITNVERARFPFLSANALDKGTGRSFGGARAYVLLKRGPIRIAVFGLTTLDTPEIEWPAAISRVRFADPIPIARGLVPRLRKVADLVICLSHLGTEQDKMLARAVPGIDIIVGGHSHTTLRERVMAGGCVITQTGAQGANLGRIDIRMAQRHGKWRVASINGANGKWWPEPWPHTALIPVPETVKRDPEVSSCYQASWVESQRLLAETLGTADADIPARASKDRRPCALLLADLLRHAVRSDVAIVPVDYGPYVPAGPVTNKTIYNIIGGFTRQNVVMVRATGRDLRAAVESAYGAGRKETVQFAGLEGLIVFENGKAVWTDAAIAGRPLDDAQSYTVAAGAYPIMDFPTLLNSPLISDHLGWLKPLIASSIRERRTLTSIAPTLKVQENQTSTGQ